MAYSFERHETVAVGVGRMLGEMTWTISHELHPGYPNHPHWVHNTRTTYKRIRSLLRLVRDSLGAETFRAERTRIREAAAQLAQLRDAEVLVLTAESLANHFPAQAEAIGDLQLWLLRRYQQIAQIETNLPQLLLATANEMNDLTLRCTNWTLPDDFEEPIHNFARGYRKGKKEFDCALEAADDEAFHEWRKQVKNHWYHCRLFDQAWLPAMMWRVSELKELSDLLGEDHDFAVLQQVLAEADDAPYRSHDLNELIQQHQQRLRLRAAELGEHIYGPDVETLTAELDTCLRRWL